MSRLIIGCFILMIVHLFCPKWMLGNADRHKDGYFILDGNNDGKYNYFNSDADIPCIQYCLSNLTCTRAVIDKSRKKCSNYEKTHEQLEYCEIWRKMPAKIEGMSIR